MSALLKRYLQPIFVLVNLCDYVVCDNGGICRQANTSRCFTCDCPYGFSGTLCQTKEEVTGGSKRLWDDAFERLIITVYFSTCVWSTTVLE